MIGWTGRIRTSIAKSWAQSVLPIELHHRPIDLVPPQRIELCSHPYQRCVLPMYYRGIVGSPGWDRTTDILINSQAQLPLCYWGIGIYLRHRIVNPEEDDGDGTHHSTSGFST